MTILSAHGMHFRALNEAVRACADPVVRIEQCLGQRYIGSALDGKDLTVEGTPGNALGAYLSGARITVHGNAQDATGDTMDAGEIFIHGSSGDATGYAMRGGEIYVRDSVGYRAGIHMKAYRDKLPVLVIGGSAGSFLGEYQAGGIIIVLGRGCEGTPVGNFCGTGMHGGQIFLRCDQPPADLPAQVTARKASPGDIASIRPYLSRYCAAFGADLQEIEAHTFYLLTPDTKNPYRQLYTNN